jgi:3-keto-disaccharide hydrolase
MKATRIPALLLSIVMLMALLGCGSSDSDSDGDSLSAELAAAAAANPTELEGVWESQCFSNSDGDDEKVLTTITGRKAIQAFDSYIDSSGATCSGSVTFSKEMTIIIDDEFNDTILTGGVNAKTLTYTVFSYTITPKTESMANTLNQQGVCGLSNWVVNTPNDVTGGSCGGTLMPSRGSRIYDVYQLNGNTLYSGDEGTGARTSDATRPTQLAMDYPHTRQAVEQPISTYTEDFSDGVADNWTVETGTWSVSGNNYLVSSGAHKNSSVSYSETVDNFELEVKMSKTVGGSDNMALFINGDPGSIDSDGNWENAYKIVYGSGDWNVGKYVNGNYTAIQNWTTSSSLNNTLGDWNIIKVRYNQNIIKVYINDSLQGTISNTSLTSGKVGLSMFDNSISGEAKFDYVTIRQY